MRAAGDEDGGGVAERWTDLSADRRGAWYGFLRTHVDITRRLDAGLRRQTGLTLGEYDVLVTLRNGPAEGLRMGDLARRVVLSPSGITRVVARLERAGLVARVAANARVVRATLTERGRVALDRAAPVHLAGVREAFLDRLSEAEAATLAEIWGRLRDREPTG